LLGSLLRLSDSERRVTPWNLFAALADLVQLPKASLRLRSTFKVLSSLTGTSSFSSIGLPFVCSNAFPFCTVGDSEQA